MVLILGLRLLSLCLRDVAAVRVILGLVQWLFSLAVLAANANFLVSLYPYNPFFSWAGTFFLGFSVASNCWNTVVVARSLVTSPHSRPHWGVLALVSLLSMNDLSVFLLVDATGGPLLACLRLGNVYYQSLPLLVIQLISLSTVTPGGTVAALFFNALGVALLLGLEAFSWVSEARGHPEGAKLTRDHFSSLGEALLPAEHEDMEEVDLDQGHSPHRRGVTTLSQLLLPVVVVSLVPQFLTVAGIPFALACLRRYHHASTFLGGVKGAAPARYPPLGPLEKRGVFLVPLNVVSMALALLVVLPWITLFTLALFLVSLLRRLLTRHDSQTPAQVRRALQSLVAVVAFAYLPFLETVPRMEQEESDGPAETVALWKKVAAVSWYLGFMVGLPIADIITDFQFSTQLLSLSRDPLLSNRDQLYAWMLVSFVTSAIGLVVDLLKFLTTFLPHFRDPSWPGWLAIVVRESIFGPKRAPREVFELLQVIQAIGEDLVQILVMTNTVSFVGPVNPLWVFKWTMSVMSSSYHISKPLVDVVFGRNTLRYVKFGLRVLYFALFVSLLSMIGLMVRDSFCLLNRTVGSWTILPQLGACQVIGGEIVLTGFTSAATQTFAASRLEQSFSVASNQGAVALTFARLDQLATEYSITGNSGSVEAVFPVMNTVQSGGSISVSDNRGVVNMSLPVLFMVQANGSISFTANQAGGALRLAGLSEVDGVLTIRGNRFSDLLLPLLQNINGVMTVSGESLTRLVFPSLYNVNGALHITNNSQLEDLELPSYTSGAVLVIQGNSRLSSLAFPVLGGVAGSVSISQNAGLRTLNFTAATALAGYLTIEGNPVLDTIVVDHLGMMFGLSGLTVSSNPALVELDLRALNCNYVFYVTLRGNANLETVRVAAPACLQAIANEGNPKLVFRCPDNPC